MVKSERGVFPYRGQLSLFEVAWAHIWAYCTQWAHIYGPTCRLALMESLRCKTQKHHYIKVCLEVRNSTYLNFENYLVHRGGQMVEMDGHRMVWWMVIGSVGVLTC